MKRVRRWLFNGLTAVSALLFVAVCVQWGRSYQREDEIDCPNGRVLLSYNGGITYVHFYGGGVGHGGLSTRWYWHGLGYDKDQDRLLLFVPDWPLLTAAGVLPAFWAGRRIMKGRTPPPGGCPKCGYDLRATPDRCPECGYLPGKKEGTT